MKFCGECGHDFSKPSKPPKLDYSAPQSYTPRFLADKIQGIIAARIDRLEESLKKVMQVASVIGKEFAFRVLQAIRGMREELKGHILNLQGLKLIYEKSLFPELEYIFKHALTQEVAYNSLLLKRRKEIHEKIGMAIEEIYRERLEEFYEVLAYHYSQSSTSEKALEYLRLSIGKALRNNSRWEALRFCKESLLLLKQTHETEKTKKERLSVILQMSGILRPLSYPEDPIEIMAEGEKLSRELNDKRSLATMHGHTASYHSFKGNAAQANVYLERCLEEEGSASDLEIIVNLSYGLIVSYMVEGKFVKMRDLTQKLIRLLEEAHRERENFGRDTNLYSSCHALCGWSMGLLGEFERAEEYCKRGTAFAHELGHLLSMGYAELLYGLVMGNRGRGEQAIQHFQKALESLEKSQGLLYLPTSWAGLSWGYYIIGNVPKALEYAEKGLRMQIASGVPFNLPWFHYCVSVAYLELEDLTKALFHAEEGLSAANKYNQRHLEGTCLIQLGMVQWKIKKSNMAEAEECIRKGINILKEMEWKPYEAQGYLRLGKLFADAGEGEKALENLKRAEQMCDRMGMDLWPARTRKALARIQSNI